MSDTNKVPATNENILRAMAREGQLSYSERIPQMLQESIANTFDTILQYDYMRNEFAVALITQLIQGRITSAYFRNPLASLMSDPMRYGETEQEIFVNMVKGRLFDGFADANSLYAYYNSEVLAAYHKMSPAMQYPITVTYDNLRNAFQTEYGVRNLIEGKVQATVAGAEYDEYNCMKQLFTSAYNSQQVYSITVADPVDEASGKALTKQMQAVIMKMKFPNPAWTIAGADSTPIPGGIYYLTTPEVQANLSVDVLAYAYNQNNLDVNAQKIIVDKFDNSHIKAVLFDMRFLRVRNQFRTMTDSRNGAALTWNYFYTLRNMYSYSPFFQIVIFTDEAQNAASVTVSDVADAEPGTDVPITALVNKATGVTTGYTLQTIDYSVSGQTSTHTQFVPGSNILHIGNDEKAATLTVTATTHYTNPTTGQPLTGTATVTMKA